MANSYYSNCVDGPKRENFNYIWVLEFPKFSNVNSDNCIWEIVKANNLGGCWGNVAVIKNCDLRQGQTNGTNVMLAEVDELFIKSLVNLNSGMQFEGLCGTGDEDEDLQYIYFKKQDHLKMFPLKLPMPEEIEYKLLKMFM